MNLRQRQEGRRNVTHSVAPSSPQNHLARSKRSLPPNHGGQESCIPTSSPRSWELRGLALLSLSVCVLALLLTGCSPQAENHTPPTPKAFMDKIDNNPNMSAAEKEAA